MADAIYFEDNGFSRGAKIAHSKKRLREIVADVDNTTQHVKRRKAAELVYIAPIYDSLDVQVHWQDVEALSLTNTKRQLLANSFMASSWNAEIEQTYVTELAGRNPAASAVSLHTLLEYGSLILGAILALSIISWWIGSESFMLVTPFPALIGLLLCPFLFAMGRAARRSS